MATEQTKATTFAALTEKRNIITALHERLGKWLSRFNRYSQMTEDLHREEEELISTASGLIGDAETFIDRAKNETGDGHDESLSISPKSDLVENSVNPNIPPIAESDTITFPNAEEIIDFQSSEPGETATEESAPSLPNKKLLKGLQLFEALKKYLALAGEKQTVPEIISGLREYGFRSEVKHPYESVRGMLRYYEKQGIFERDGATWGLSRKGENNTVIKFVSKKDTQFQLKQGGEKTEHSFDNLATKNKPSSSGTKTNPEYCEEILRNSGQEWLHVDQILVILKNDYGVIRNKEIVAAALRKKARQKRIFKAFVGNRFGLLDAHKTEVVPLGSTTPQSNSILTA